MTAPAGNYAGLNLGVLPGVDGAHAGLNLGVYWSDAPPDPPDPPEAETFYAASGMRWASAASLRRAVVTGWRQSPQHRRTARLAWGRAEPLHRALTLAWDAPPRVRRAASPAWRGSIPLVRQAAALPWMTLPTARRSASMAWRQQGMAQRSASMPWRNPGLARMARLMPWLARLVTRTGASGFPWFNPALAKRIWRIPWGQAPQIPWVVRPPVVPDPPVIDTPFPLGSHVGLNLGCPVMGMAGIAPLNLGVTACYAVRPQRRTYLVTNTVSVVRLPDRTPIDVDSISISGSVDSWGYSFDLNLINPAQLTLLKPTVAGPRQIEIALNGYVWTALVESYSRSREFNLQNIRITGRSRTALLEAPYAPQRAKITTATKLAAQLVDEELADTDYTATYDTVDWLVPAGAFYYDATTAMEAITRVAQASGAVVQSDPEDLTLIVRPRYPISPWDWTETAPDAVLQDDIVTAEQLQVRSAPLYDAVVVTGEIAGKGVTATIKRDGEAGTLYAPMASSALINTGAVAAERGRNILSDRGEQASIDLVLPLFAEPLGEGQTGRVLPLDLVEVQSEEGTWPGLCTGVRIDVRMDSRATVIEQTLTLERHYSDAN